MENILTEQPASLLKDQLVSTEDGGGGGKKSKLIFVITALLSILSISAALYFYFRQESLKKQLSEKDNYTLINTYQECEQHPSSQIDYKDGFAPTCISADGRVFTMNEESIMPMYSWIYYADDLLGISFEYPPSWAMSDSQLGTGKVITLVKGEAVIQFVVDANIESAPISVYDSVEEIDVISDRLRIFAATKEDKIVIGATDSLEGHSGFFQVDDRSHLVYMTFPKTTPEEDQLSLLSDFKQIARGLSFYSNEPVSMMPVESFDYTCPSAAQIDCTADPNSEEKPECGSFFLEWAADNCPDFQGTTFR